MRKRAGKEAGREREQARHETILGGAKMQKTDWRLDAKTKSPVAGGFFNTSVSFSFFA